jgi:hypothetical protein
MSSMTVMFGMTEHFLQEMRCGGSRHDDHGPEGNVLHVQRQAFVFAVLGHSLCLRAEFAEVVGWGYGHRNDLPLDEEG